MTLTTKPSLKLNLCLVCVWAVFYTSGLQAETENNSTIDTSETVAGQEIEADIAANEEAKEEAKEQATEQAREREQGAEEDPMAQRQADRVDRPVEWSDKPDEFKLYGSVRIRYRKTDSDSFWGDGGSRFGVSGNWQYKPFSFLFGRAEAGTNLLDQLDLLINRSGSPSNNRFTDNIFLRLAYVGIETPEMMLTLGKNWSTYYRVTSFTDRFQGTGASASGTYNAGTDGGPTGTGRADKVLQSRLLVDYLADKLGLKPFKLNLQLQHGNAIPNVADAKYATTIGLSALIETRDDLTIGLAYNHANVTDKDNPALLEQGISGDAQAATLGVRWFSENWYLASVTARLKNHETTNELIYFDGWGWEVYSQYNVYKRWWAVAGWNILEPDSDQTQAGDYNQKYGVIGVRYSFDGFRQMIFSNARIDEGHAQDGTALGNIYTIGVRWDLP